jgi:hypothetical protein
MDVRLLFVVSCVGSDPCDLLIIISEVLLVVYVYNCVCLCV